MPQVFTKFIGHAHYENISSYFDLDLERTGDRLPARAGERLPARAGEAERARGAGDGLRSLRTTHHNGIISLDQNCVDFVLVQRVTRVYFLARTGRANPGIETYRTTSARNNELGA